MSILMLRSLNPEIVSLCKNWSINILMIIESIYICTPVIDEFLVYVL